MAETFWRRPGVQRSDSPRAFAARGPAAARLLKSCDVVEVVTAELQRNETIFLHEMGVDAECDEARSSLDAKMTTRRGP